MKPEIVQINLEVCCVVPPELASFARANDIQLLTHNDPKGNPNNILIGLGDAIRNKMTLNLSEFLERRSKEKHQGGWGGRGASANV